MSNYGGKNGYQKTIILTRKLENQKGQNLSRVTIPYRVIAHLWQSTCPDCPTCQRGVSILLFEICCPVMNIAYMTCACTLYLSGQGSATRRTGLSSPALSTNPLRCLSTSCRSYSETSDQPDEEAEQLHSIIQDSETVTGG